ncbi:D-alanyl-D-alanine carboxypeptidase/D-alanyl-D-alanine-endopeptidase (penicillin-binding protein 4) [Desulfobotulus alkaliphilus]|uniref:D-alanyl-D-alanine carboxypeptidase/D-alanyl-D-alanine-endopeptidase (Penicillin-binding protein 4) n=1 Tax=Desulfobotulus alkaliphilus TaxID=622671 RepID=A0A562RIG3_9BACT|nr:D-alanyl-D-alanine carboxypeptidase [Desulfobotulus alkaliphilus]TWI68879.1 D-alanyl-D-alanine carboxypeptidase/D-alanyl-D-alanine-endopeptidase (penicillin-binding protein 4) [Desulfobotulus alkaliphilus]
MRFLYILILFFLFLPSGSAAERQGGQKAWILETPGGEILSATNPNATMTPASILKILTSLYALETLGPDYRISTSISKDKENFLVIGASADPLLTSNPIRDMVNRLAASTPERNFQGIIIDISNFEKKLPVDGINPLSRRSYNAPLTPFAVNFNSVAFKTEKGHFISAENETPLLPMVMTPVRDSRLASGRIALPSDNDFPMHYAAAMLRYFLEEAGFTFEKTETAFRYSAPAIPDILLLTYASPFTVTDIVHQLMAFSNNYVANKLLLATALQDASHTGPLSLEKAGIYFSDYIKNKLGIEGFVVEEGSGLSRKNQITAREMLKALHAFSPYMSLMRRESQGWFKTGTLSDVRTRAGYLRGPHGWYPYVLMTHGENDAYPLYLNILRKEARTGRSLSSSGSGMAPDNPARN